TSRSATRSTSSRAASRASGTCSRSGWPTWASSWPPSAGSATAAPPSTPRWSPSCSAAAAAPTPWPPSAPASSTSSPSWPRAAATPPSPTAWSSPKAPSRSTSPASSASSASRRRPATTAGSWPCSPTCGPRSDAGEDPVKGPGHGEGVEGAGEQPRVAELAAAARAQEAVELLLKAAVPLGGLALQGPERPELALGGDDALGGGGAEAADQLVLQVGDAHIEPGRLQPGPAWASPEAGPLQPEPDVALLAGVTEAGQLEPQPAGTVPLQVAADVPGPAHGDHADALGGEVAASALGDGLERDLVADPFDEHHRPNLVVHRASLVQPPPRVAARPGVLEPAGTGGYHARQRATFKGRSREAGKGA